MLDITLDTMEGSATASGDAIGSISGDALGGNDNITLTFGTEMLFGARRSPRWGIIDCRLPSSVQLVRTDRVV